MRARIVTKFSALMSLRSRDNIQANTLVLIVICVRMLDLPWCMPCHVHELYLLELICL